MEIKSIKKIVQVGAFSNFCDGGSKRFEKLTLLYGLNAHGKTTLCDVFQSLAKNDSEILSQRKTIPLSSTSQLVEMSIKPDENERTIKFKDGKWDSNVIDNHIEVFGTDFIHKNVFTGLTIERQNKENFTDFILGTEGADYATKLEKTNHDLRNKRSEIKNAIPPYVIDETEDKINSFISLKVTEDVGALKNTLKEKTAILVSEEKKLGNVNSILNKNEPIKFNKSNLKEFLACIRYINSILIKSFESLKEEAVLKLQNHIHSNFKNIEDAEFWIKQGLDISNFNIDDAQCPFCGQDLKTVQDLIGVYQTYFNEEYIQYINNIETSLDESLQNISSKEIEYSKNVSDSLLIIKDYQDLITDEIFNKNISELEIKRNSISQLEEKLKGTIQSLLSDIAVVIDTKKRTPHKSIKSFDYSLIQPLIDEFIQEENTIDSLVDFFIESIKNFKNSYTTDEKKEFVDKLNKEINVLNLKIARLEQNNLCEKYKIISAKISELENEQERLKKALIESQSDYLEKYYKEINKLFVQFGSRDFTLIMDTDDRGFKKVYSLSVKYKNHKITAEQLPFIFSESDRRALALAVFWAKINLKDEGDLQNSIIIFDDPITSFDDQRITKTINLTKETLSKVSQIIILTHYPNLITRFLEITKIQQLTYKLLEVKKESASCVINTLDSTQFLLDEHNKNFLYLYNFINRKHDNDVKSDLRPYLENHLKRIFFKQILDFNLDEHNLENLINGLKENVFITEQQQTKLHEFRRTTNPDNHIFTSRNIDDVRNFTTEMLDFLHSLSFM
ncbi:MAG: AAA family ATPase [Calditrichaceae bacterium]